MLREIRPAIVFLVGLVAITGLVYPLAMTGAAQLLFPYRAQGSLIEKNGQVIGSSLIGQQFSEEKDFHGRPSATTAPDPQDSSKTIPAPYNVANSGDPIWGRPARRWPNASRKASKHCGRKTLLPLRRSIL